MSKVYAMVEGGRVTNITIWDGVMPGDAPPPEPKEDGGAPIGAWTPPEGVEMVAVTEDTGEASIGAYWDGNRFAVPASNTPAPKPTAGEVKGQRDALLALATLRVDPLADAVELGEATEEEADALLLWRKYRVDLSRIEQQPGFPEAVVWPEQPA